MRGPAQPPAPPVIPTDQKRLSKIALTALKVEQVEQVANGRHVDGDVRIVVIHAGVRQVIAATLGELAEIPVALDKLHE